MANFFRNLIGVISIIEFELCNTDVKLVFQSFTF